MAHPFSVVILAGGGARRMGENKAFLEVGGRQILERELEAIRCRDVILAVEESAPYAEALARFGWESDPADGSVFSRPHPTEPATPRVRILEDREPGLGPLAALVWALEATAEDRCWVLSCDLPFVTPGLGIRLLAELDDPGPDQLGEADRPLAAVPTVAGQVQPLCAAYRRDAWRMAASLLEGGRRSMRELLTAIPLRHIPEERFRSIGDPRKLFLNVNTPADLQTAHRLAATG